LTSGKGAGGYDENITRRDIEREFLEEHGVLLIVIALSLNEEELEEEAAKGIWLELCAKDVHLDEEVTETENKRGRWRRK